MKIVNRILQFLTLAGAVASGMFYYYHQLAGSSTLSELEIARNQLNAERARAERLADTLAERDRDGSQDAEAAQRAISENALLTAQLGQLQRENQRLADERDSRLATEERLQRENVRLGRELAETKAATVPKEQLDATEQRIAALEREILDLRQTTATSQSRSSMASQPLGRPPENPSLRGSILTVGKGASFVVLDIGYNHGVRLQNELLIQHADTPIARIQITEVKENLSIARILPDTVIKLPQSGDTVASLN